MEIKIINKKMTQSELQDMAKLNYENMVKGIVDIHKKILALGGELHADAETKLLEEGSLQENLWGFNIYIDRPPEARIVYHSFINIRPRDGNHSMEITDPGLRTKIKEIIDQWVE